MIDGQTYEERCFVAENRVEKLVAQRDELAAALRSILEYDSLDCSMHIKGMRSIAYAALEKVQI